MWKFLLRKYGAGVVVCLGVTTITACSSLQSSMEKLPPVKMVEKVGTNQVLRFTERNLVPPMLSGDDVSMACASGESITPMLMATGGLGADTDQLGTLLYATASLCAEHREAEDELRYMRAVHDNLISDAQDARISQRRWAAVASKRQYYAYQRFSHYYESEFKIKIGEQCPAFAKDFDEMVYMLGLLSGLQAIINDINSQNAIGVPKDIAPKVDRAMRCLDNEKWFGVPMATRAAVWSLLPGSAGEKDPWETFKLSNRVGERHGIRLAHALYVLVAYTKADDAHLRDALKSFASTEDGGDFQENTTFRLFDSMAEMEVIATSDRYWTDHTGARTPFGSIGKFWDDTAINQRTDGTKSVDGDL